ncbi:MAG TPA: NUDIX hydrolase [Bryobacteraceae bacterium]|nr:NUDIX hydrolase [Bryobacteraceae bacterium]
MPSDSYQQAIARLDTWIDDPGGGLPEEFFLFLTRFTPMINVDLVVRDERNRILLTWREDEFYGPGWHVPGGIIRYKEILEDRIHATARAELGADVEFDPMPEFILQSIEPERRDRGHFISLAYHCRLAGPPDAALQFTGGRPGRGQWAWHEHCPADLIPLQAAYRRFFS